MSTEDLTRTRGWTITRAPVPEALDSPEAWALLGSVEAGRAVDVALYGHDDLAYTPAESHTHLRGQEYSTKVLLVATPAERSDAAPDDSPAVPRAADVVGSVTVTMPTEGSTRSAFVELRVRPDARRAGAGTALLEAAEALAAEHGRTSLIAHTEQIGEPSPDEPHLEPPTGSGRIRPDDAGARFALHRDYALEQAERYSVLELPVARDLVDRLHAEASARSGAYRTVSWIERTPDRWVDDVAHLATRMSTDVPRGELDVEEDPWDADRIRAAEADLTAADKGCLVVAAEHLSTGRLVAYTMVTFPLDRPEVVFQDDTMVLSEHRGHRLGLLIKTAALELLGELRPGARRLHTWNAEENEHMLAINVALGFRPTGVTGMWQKKSR